MCQEGKEIRIWAETEMRSNEAMNQSKVRISIHDADNVSFDERNSNGKTN